MSIDNSADERLEKRARAFAQHRRALATQKIYTGKEPSAESHVDSKEGLYDSARAHIGDGPINYLEFGVRNGKSMSRILSRFTHPDSRFYGFDSFVGLPEKWHNREVGKFSTGGKKPDFNDSRVELIEGWFQNTLPGFLAAHDLSGRPLLVHHDADLYSATLFCMTSLWHKVDEQFFIFDEFMSDEVVAMYDFALAYPIEYEFFAQTDIGMIQIFGRMKRIALHVEL